MFVAKLRIESYRWWYRCRVPSVLLVSCQAQKKRCRVVGEKEIWGCGDIARGAAIRPRHSKWQIITSRLSWHWPNQDGAHKSVAPSGHP
jgi:hypothetical protein